MDRIRVRIWDGEKQEMLSWDDLIKPGKYPEAHPLGCLTSHTDGSWQVMLESDFMDANGKYITDGDIIKNVYNDESEPGGIGFNYLEVRFVNGAFCWVGEVTGDNNPFYIYPLDSFEIAGNIYQNKELLE